MLLASSVLDELAQSMAGGNIKRYMNILRLLRLLRVIKQLKRFQRVQLMVVASRAKPRVTVMVRKPLGCRQPAG